MSWKRRFIPALLLLTVVACEGADPTSPVAEPADAGANPFILDRYVSVSGEDYTPIVGTPPSGSLLDLGWLGLLGGKLDVAGHVLNVPLGAVLQPTLFVMARPNDNSVEVSLWAFRLDLLGRLINVGELGFNKKVKLTMTYEWATNVTDPSQLVILYVPDDGGPVEALPTTVNQWNKTATVWLDHFSKYCMASN